LNVYYGNLNGSLYIYEHDITDYWERDDVVHVAITWSNNGSEISSDGSTLRLYLYGQLQAKVFDTWNVNDGKKVNFYLGGKIPFVVAQNYGVEVSSIDSVVSDLRMYNYCKTDFNDTLFNVDSEEGDLIHPSELIELSKDNLTFYKVGDINLPLYWDDVAADVTVPLYVRTSLPRGLTGRELRTAGIIVQWDVGV
jgi:hypothetical protein